MRPIAALIVALDELAALAGKDGGCPPPAPAGELAVWTRLARQGRDVWLVASRAAEQPLPHGVHRAASLQEAARQCPAPGSRVLVVGADPSASVRFANRHRLTSVLIDPGGDGPEARDLEEVPDFTLACVEELPALLERLERDPADFQGTE